MRVALVHDWLTGMRGGERCLEPLLDSFPDAEIFTLLHVPGSVSRRIEERPIHTSFVQRLPASAAMYRYYLPLFPAAIERLDLSGFDLVLSISHCVAKGVRVPPGVPHLCYCLTPMRYVWDLYDAYFGGNRASWPVRATMPLVADRLRRWDVASARRPQALMACSRYIAGRIRRCYDRDADVVYPPVDVERFEAAPIRDDFYLVVSALVPYKRVDLVIEAFNRLNRRLVVIGQGPELARLRRLAGPGIAFLGWREDAEVADWLSRCRAFVFPALDDFGITAVEAQAAGAPVIAFASGGAMETVFDFGPEAGTPAESISKPRSHHASHPEASTGVFFQEQTADALIAAVLEFEARAFDTVTVQANARRFGVERFREDVRRQLDQVLYEPVATTAAHREEHAGPA